MTSPPRISPADALDTLDRAIGTISMNRQSHANAQQCVQVLVEMIERCEKLTTESAILARRVSELEKQVAGLLEQLQIVLLSPQETPDQGGVEEGTPDGQNTPEG